MKNSNLIFISHSSKDNAHALELYNLLLEINPEWKGKIFLDCCEEKPLENHDEWRARMLKEVENSRHLIFITSSLDYIKEGNGWLFEEVSHFQNLKANRNNLNRSELNVSYFGIFFCDCDFENALFNDPLRGSEYRRIYQRPEHLMLEVGETVAVAKERIKDKINQLVSDDRSDETATLLLDKTREFALQKEKNDYMFNKNSIDECLIPHTSIGTKKLDFNEFCSQVQKSHISLLGSEGGCGKTTILTKLFYYHLDNSDIKDSLSMIPLYVDAKTLVAENNLILRYLAKNLFDEHTAMTDRSTSKSVGLLDYEFSKKRESPRYLLIVDGYNEIPDSCIAKFDNELLDFLPSGRYANVRVVISGRHIGNNLPQSVFEQILINPLEGSAVSAYLRSKGVWKGKVKESLFRILSIPMYLKMYAETSADERIQDKADLLCAFVEWQQNKDVQSAANDEKKALYKVLLKHILPIIAHAMLMKNKGDSSFLLSRDELEEILVDAIKLLCTTEYKKFYGREYREQLRTSNFSDYDELDLSDLSVEYFVRTSKMLRSDSDGNLDFVHQIYRDFFCAWFITEHIKRSVDESERCASFSTKLLDVDITEFITELLREQAPYFDTEKDSWDYSCNENSLIVPLLEINRGKNETNTAIVVANIIGILKYARKDDLSGLDFSNLDLTKTLISNCLFYRYDKNGQNSTSFANSKINRENIFTENHFDEILAACTNENFVACIDSTGVIKFWDRKRFVSFPIKIITDVRYSIYKMIFNRDNNKIYAMTAHEILEIAIPDGFSSKAEPQIIFKTTKRLRDIIIDENDKIFFTTNLNSFNFKCIESPDSPDNYNFYGINSGASVNESGTRLAFGYIGGYESLKIYDYFNETNDWKERRFGYFEILNDFIFELENFFRKAKLYHLFPTDNDGYDSRRTYFSYIQQQFEDCTHHHDRIPAIIAERCRERLENKNYPPIKMYDNQLKKLKMLVEKYENILKNEMKLNNLLMLISGRKITGITFKKGTNTLLLSCVIDYEEKLKNQKGFKKINKNKQYDSIVLELDTDTFETRFITRFVGTNSLRAFYCGDDILVLSKYHFTIYDKNGSDIVHVTTCPKTIQNFITPKNKDTFFAISQHFIYEFDKNLHCVKSMDNVFRTVDLSLSINSSGKEFLSRRKALTNAESSQTVKVIDLSNGRIYETVGGEFDVTVTKVHSEPSDMKFKICSEKLVSFKDDIKYGETDIPYKLFVCGCDFRNVQGSVTDLRYMQMLHHMGALIDEIQFPETAVIASDEGFTASTAELVFPENIDEKRVPYSLCEKLSLEEDCYFSDAIGGNQLYVQKTWDLINKGSYSTNDLEEADYSILEWISRLNFSLSYMITDLVEAGIIEKPTRFQDVSKRLAGPLHRTFKFLFRSQFCQNGVGKKAPVYTVCFPYGATLLRHITGHKIENQLYILNSENRSAVKKPGRSNKFICIHDGCRLREIRKTLALNQWFTLTAARYKNLIKDYSLNTKFDTDNHYNGRANIHGFIQLGEQSFFAESFRSLGVEKIEPSLVFKVYRMCIISIYYRSLMRYGQQMNSLKKQPIIVLIGEDFEHCKLLNTQIENIYPNVRKLFTFDALLTSKEAFDGAGNYFEFVCGTPHSVRLDDLL